jgi:hypothetical protein
VAEAVQVLAMVRSVAEPPKILAPWGSRVDVELERVVALRHVRIVAVDILDEAD